MDGGDEKDTDASDQVSERRFGNSGFVELIYSRQHWYSCYGQGVQKHNMIQSPSPTALSQGFRNTGQEYTQSIGPWIWHFFESCTTNINRSP